MTTFTKYFLGMTAILLFIFMASAQQIRTPRNKKDTVKLKPAERDSLKRYYKGSELYRALLLKESKIDSTK
jgi:hypothetical protein